MATQTHPDWHAWNTPPYSSIEEKTRAHFREYAWFLNLAEKAWERKNAQATCIYASLAAQVATHRHCGFFASPRLEQLLINVGRDLPDKTSYRRSSNTPANAKRVLHVCTEVANIGGLASMLVRLIKTDSSRQHSLVLTRTRSKVPAHIAEAVEESGGAVHRLHKGSPTWAELGLNLRRLARDHDLIVLHVYNEDVVPLLAFAKPDTTPPVLFINHADHLFWLGFSVSDLVINLRESGRTLAQNRRFIRPERNAFVPTLVGQVDRKRSTIAAKRELGVDLDAVLLVSVARTVKYRTQNSVTFADTHVPLLLDNPNARLIVVGAGEPEDWQPAKAATGGRISSLAPVRDPSVYFEAADIYVDSYPFVSTTSVIEAAGYSLPLVSRFYAPKEAEIVSVDQPGPKASAMFASSDNEYIEILRKLIADPDLRQAKGNAAERAVAAFHHAPAWSRFWETAIEAAVSLQAIDPAEILRSAVDETPAFGEPDARIHEMFGMDVPTSIWIRDRLRYMPFGDRVARWNEVRKSGLFYNARNAVQYILPDRVLALLGR